MSQQITTTFTTGTTGGQIQIQGTTGGQVQVQGGLNPFVCPRNHPMTDSILYCSRCGLRAHITHSCYSCQYHLCQQCSLNWNGNLNVQVQQTTTTTHQEERKGQVGVPCNQCHGGIVFGKTNNRDPICFMCKKQGHQFTYWCKTCDLDICEGCVEEFKKKAMETMNQFMQGSGMGGMMGMMGGGQGQQQMQ